MRPDRGPLLDYVRVAKQCSRRDASAILRVLAELRLADTEVQLPMAQLIVDEFVVRLFLFSCIRS